MRKLFTSTLMALFLATGLEANAQHAKTTIEHWPETAKKAAKAMIDKYGEPQEQTEGMLIWKDTGPFTHTVVYKEEIQHNFPMPHKDVLEQVINYEVPAEKFSDLARYDGSVIVERTKGTMAARCDKEAANYLALNLAHDIIQGTRTVDEAREMYAGVIMQMLKGEEHGYLQKLAFSLPQKDITNPDETIMDMSEVKRLKNK